MPRSGARTPIGKALASRNATRHAIFARTPVILGHESMREWNDHRNAIIAALEPADAVEQSLADRYADAIWRLRRLRRHEVAVINASIDRIPSEMKFARDSERLLTAAIAPNAVAWAKDSAAFLRGMPAMSGDTPVPLPEIRRLLSALRCPEANTMPVDTVGQVRPAFEAAATSLGVTLLEVVEEFARAAERAVGIHSGSRAEVAAEVERRSQLCLIPDKDELDRVIRYEAHLHRIAMSALHELEARQARRRGESTPLARIDVG